MRRSEKLEATAVIAGCLLFFLLPLCARGERPRHEMLREAQWATVEVLVNGILKGGGAFVGGDGFIITTAHLFHRMDAQFEVITESDRRLTAYLVAFDLGHDLALLRVSEEARRQHREEFSWLPVADEIPPVGSPVFNLGVALRNRGVVMHGMVAQDQPVFTDLSDSNGYVEHYFVSAMTPSLTSGGVWVNGAGEIVGVQSARLNDGALTSGVAVVAPPDAVRRLIETKQTASTPGIGGWVWEVWTADADFLKQIPPGTEGLLISWLREDGPLAKAGLQRLDVILACNGKQVRRRADLLRIVRGKRPGSTVSLEVLRPGDAKSREVAVELEDLEAMRAEAGRQGEGGG